ncbi:acetyltransferase [Olleya marilimosa]|jgi:sugar O-acyltransferase (sialic acid O-acetyltransferase NeuD family)|uniref:Acetyltransferase n=1 Tax=Olleya marilimosa TaxID=272164 RepID=A0ABR8LYQ4_9FLAO|nr:acetyltransferase [Olleya marilimosa]MBD3863142.1 acetyltransferase [Olleya marilimosa]MBD3890640.1 acetyltransferase [Olleya marilimosa]
MKYLFGASGHAKVVLDIIESKNINIEGVFDDNKKDECFQGLPFLGKLESGNQALNQGEFIIAIGNNKIRKEIVNNTNVKYFSACHNNSFISRFSKIEEGTVVMNNATINSGAKIGSHCIINTAAVIEHDCVIEDFSHISPNATLTGNVKVGEGTHIGAGAIVIPNITIGKWCVIGAGAVVLENIPDNSVVVGNPARIIKKV